jgi:hypothetical protein
VDERGRVDVRERGQPEAGFADQLGQHAARAEGDERPEDRVLDDSGEELDAALDHRLHEHRPADARGGGANRVLVGQVERDAAGLGLVGAGLGGLHDDREADLGRGDGGLVRPRCGALGTQEHTVST